MLWKRICILLLAALLLTLPACSAPEEAPQLLEYPGTSWNATPAQVMESLGLVEEDLAENAWNEPMEPSEEYNALYTFSVQGMDFFGVTAQTVLFRFLGPSWNEEDVGLWNVIVYLPEDTDMTELRANMEERYGSGENLTPPYDIGALALTTVRETDGMNPPDACWKSAVPPAEGVSQKAVDAYAQNLCNRYDSENREDATQGTLDVYIHETNPLKSMTPEEIRSYANERPLVELFLTQSAHTGMEELPDQWSRKAVVFDAGYLFTLLQLDNA